MSDTTIHNLHQILQSGDLRSAYAYTLGAVGQAAENALRELDAFLSRSRVDRMRIMDDQLARVRSSLLDAMEARQALRLAIEERRAALDDCPEPHGARRTGGVA